MHHEESSFLHDDQPSDVVMQRPDSLPPQTPRHGQAHMSFTEEKKNLKVKGTGISLKFQVEDTHFLCDFSLSLFEVEFHETWADLELAT